MIRKRLGNHIFFFLSVGPGDPKIQFYQTIKDIEQRLADPDIILNSFIVSNTPSHEVKRLWGISKPEMVKQHVLFQEEDKPIYIGELLDKTVGG